MNVDNLCSKFIFFKFFDAHLYRKLFLKMLISYMRDKNTSEMEFNSFEFYIL